MENLTKSFIEAFDYANTITQKNDAGILFTTKVGDEVDTMVIGWGLIGNVWKRPLFVAYVRTSRHSFDLVEQSGEFTINVPEGKLDPEVFRVAGTQSGRDIDKINQLGLTLVEPEVINTPGILECPITLECKVIYKQMLDGDALPDDIIARSYPPEVDDVDALANRYLHMVYYGEIVSSYVIQA